ncbi:MAG: glutathione S-transferase N-terminal domain-containing protein [Atopobiaceae bacterium]|jgi:glutaredoxin|nr:glutathione S-transferase N-terminal domain-containing protein [Atopobiaceae bacterium]MCI2173063.1 glutathione S-transferase N-terminal domain-containing protein [Atopobiaceae bacterium]MCI2208156.1 glutathione S-transferase N-terminal domain-containing protein [Atopobiaceae bacterium]
MSEKESLELYFMPTCPFCRKVLAFVDANGIDLVRHDITADAAAAERLVAVGGKRQVPCLFHDGKPLYESDDIIDYLGSR